jgi:hypothetical protein
MKTRGLRLNSFNAPIVSRDMRLRSGSSLSRNWKSPVAPARTRVIFKLSPMPLKPAKSLAIKLGDSGIEKPKLEYEETELEV